ncbi:TRAP transporter small permease [Virgibacillus oceani]
MKFKDIIAKILTYLCIIVITGLTVIVFVQVISRLIQFSFPGGEELARLLIVWLTFLGSSLAIHEKMHLAVNFFVKRAKEKSQKVIYFTVNVLMIIFFGIIVIYGFSLTMGAMSTTSSTLQMPMGLFYLPIPLSGLFSIYFIMTSMFSTPAEEETAV